MPVPPPGGSGSPAFRAGLLRHIALEEKFLLPRVRATRGGEGDGW